MFSSEAVCLPEHTVCATSAQCIMGPKVTFATQEPVHTMQGHSIRSAHILFLAVPNFNVSIAFYTLWEDAGQQS